MWPTSSGWTGSRGGHRDSHWDSHWDGHCDGHSDQLTALQNELFAIVEAAAPG